MHATNSSGRRVSLLNDEPLTSRSTIPNFNTRDERDEPSQLARSNSYNSQSSSPRTPDLLRSDSYDSRMTLDPASPLTPSLMEFGRQSSYTTAYPDPTQYDQRSHVKYPQKMIPQSSSVPVRPLFLKRSPSSLDEDQNASERLILGKRYPCRFKDSHGCEKTFTTSGHASRHSKIHTAEKCVQCSFQGCHKKFTRADNMKQHLETHYKERTRGSSSSHKSSSSSSSKLAVSAGVNKNNTRISRPSSRTGRPDPRPVKSLAHHGTFSSSTDSGRPPGASPISSYDSMNMGGFERALPTSLDVLALAATT